MPKQLTFLCGRYLGHMIRSLLTFALIALLMAPQFVTAKDHHGDAMVGAAGSETPQSDSHTYVQKWIRIVVRRISYSAVT